MCAELVTAKKSLKLSGWLGQCFLLQMNLISANNSNADYVCQSNKHQERVQSCKVKAPILALYKDIL